MTAPDDLDPVLKPDPDGCAGAIAAIIITNLAILVIALAVILFR
jgi:hypothetical protein